MRNSIPSPI